MTRRMTLAAAFAASLFAMANAPAAPAASDAAATGKVSIVRFAAQVDPSDQRDDFAADLLALALSASDRPYRVERLPKVDQREARAAALAGRVDVITLPSISTDAAPLMVVRAPIRRGLLGVRLLLATPERAEALAKVRDVATLKREFRKGYGADWLDRRELEGLGFRMTLADDYRGTFALLRDGRADYLSRGVSEVFAELRQPGLAGRGMVIVPGIALYYPLDDYFVVRSGQRRLRDDIARGLERVKADGRYAALFNLHYGAALAEARLTQRIVLHVSGYAVPAGTPLEKFDVIELTRSEGRLVLPTP